MGLWHSHGFHTRSVVLKRKVLGTKFVWCSDRDSWLERCIIAYQEGWRINSTGDRYEPRDGPVKLVDALVWRFRFTRESDAAVGGMIMSPPELVRCECAHNGGKIRMHCDCMWCSKHTACVYTHEADKKYDPHFGDGVKLPPMPMGVGRDFKARMAAHGMQRHNCDHITTVCAEEAPEPTVPANPRKKPAAKPGIAAKLAIAATLKEEWAPADPVNPVTSFAESLTPEQLASIFDKAPLNEVKYWQEWLAQKAAEKVQQLATITAPQGVITTTDNTTANTWQPLVSPSYWETAPLTFNAKAYYSVTVLPATATSDPPPPPPPDTPPTKPKSTKKKGPSKK